MEDKPLNTQESLDLISRMISDTRQNFNDRGGAMFLIWGYTTIFVTLAVFAALLITKNSSVMWLWWMLPVVGGALTAIHNRKHRRPVQTHLDKTVNYVWTVFAVATMACVVFTFATSAVFWRPAINIFFVISLLIGMSTALTGLIIKFRAVTIGGFTAMAAAFIFPVFNNIWQIPIFALIFLVAQVIPGHILNRVCKKETEERS